MAVRHGYGKIAGTDALVFAYDTGDTRNSYIGEPATNLALFSMNAGFSSDYPSNITFTDDSIVTYQGRQSKRVVATGQWNIYKYPRSGNYTATSSTTFTYSFKIKWSDGHTPYFSNGYIYTDAIATYPGITIRAIEDGWFWCYCTYNTTSSPPTLTGFTTTDTGTCWIVDWQLEAGRLHPTPYVAPGGTRSSTQGLLDLTGNSTIDISPTSFNSNAEIEYDGSNDYIYVGSKTWSFPNGATVEQIIKPLTLNLQQGFFTLNGPGSYINFWMPPNNTMRWEVIGTTSQGYSTINCTTVFQTGQYYHVVGTFNGTTTNIYINGIEENVQTMTNQPTSMTAQMDIGRYDTSYPSSAQIPVTKFYTRPLTAAEIKNNYNQYKTRFNI